MDEKPFCCFKRGGGAHYWLHVHCSPANPDILRPERDIFWTGSGHFFERTFFELDPDLFWAFFSPDTDNGHVLDKVQVFLDRIPTDLCLIVS